MHGNETILINLFYSAGIPCKKIQRDFFNRFPHIGEEEIILTIAGGPSLVALQCFRERICEQRLRKPTLPRDFPNNARTLGEIIERNAKRFLFYRPIAISPRCLENLRESPNKDFTYSFTRCSEEGGIANGN